MRIRALSRRFGRILATLAVHMVLILGLGIVRFKVGVGDWPSRRNAAVVRDLPEVLLAQPEESRAIEFRVSADVIVGVRMKVLAFPVFPYFFGVVLPLQIDNSGVPVVLLPRHVVTAFKQKNLLSCGR